MQLWDRVARVVPPSAARFGGPARVAAAVVAAAAVLVGIWVTGAVLTDDATVAMAATAGWIGLAVVLAVVAGLRWRALALPVVGAVLLTSGVVGGALAWSSRVDRVVEEDVVTVADALPPGPPAAPSTPSGSVDTGRVRPPTRATSARPPSGPVLLRSGAFRSGEHETTGTAALLRLPSGRAVVTLTRLDTSPGPDLRVYLAVGPTGKVAGALDLGRLRGNRGTQQYEVPDGVDLARYGAVVIWCRAFTVAFGTASLRPAG